MAAARRHPPEDTRRACHACPGGGGEVERYFRPPARPPMASLMGTFGRVEIAVPRAGIDTTEGKTTEWKSSALRAYQRRTKRAASLIAGADLAGTNTRRVRRALAAVF